VQLSWCQIDGERLEAHRRFGKQAENLLNRQ